MRRFRTRDDSFDWGRTAACGDCHVLVRRADLSDHFRWHEKNRPTVGVSVPGSATTPKSQITESGGTASFRCFRCGLVAAGLPVTGAGSYGRGHEEVCDGPPTGAGYRQVLDLKPGDVVGGLGEVVQVVDDVGLKGKCRVWIIDERFGRERGAYLLPSFAYVPLVQKEET